MDSFTQSAAEQLLDHVECNVIATDIVIVGGGVSGLSAAYRLVKKDPTLKVVVLEAKDRVGGRTIGKKLQAAFGHDYWDLGGQWVGTCQHEVMQLLAELGLQTYNQYTTGRKLMQFGDSPVSSYLADIPSLSLFALVDLYLFMYRLDRMRRQINIDSPGDCRHAAEWDNVTLEHFKRTHIWTKGASDAFDAASRCIYGVEPSHMSLLYFLTYIACAGGLDPIISSKKNFGGQELRVKGGAWQICSRLQQAISHSVDIQLNSAVKCIQQLNFDEDNQRQTTDKEEEATRGSVTVETSTGVVYKCHRVILAVPPNQASLLMYKPNLPLSKLHVFQRMPVGHLTKIVCTYSTAFWREAGYSGEIVTSGGRSIIPSCTNGPLCIVFDATSSDENPALAAFIGGHQQQQYAHLSAAERRHAVLHSLSEFLGSSALSPLDYVEMNWNEEQYNGGCPVCVGTPGMMTEMAPALRQPFKNIHFAGTESATAWCGFLNGAVQSGYRAAHEVLYELRRDKVTSESDDLLNTCYNRKESTSISAMTTVIKPRCYSSVIGWSLGLGCISSLIVAYILHRGSSNF